MRPPVRTVCSGSCAPSPWSCGSGSQARCRCRRAPGAAHAGCTGSASQLSVTRSPTGLTEGRCTSTALCDAKITGTITDSARPVQVPPLVPRADAAGRRAQVPAVVSAVSPARAASWPSTVRERPPPPHPCGAMHVCTISSAWSLTVRACPVAATPRGRSALWTHWQQPCKQRWQQWRRQRRPRPPTKWSRARGFSRRWRFLPLPKTSACG
jgi:hypothetical protein